MSCGSCGSDKLELDTTLKAADQDRVGRGSKRYVCLECGQIQWVPPRAPLNS